MKSIALRWTLLLVAVGLFTPPALVRADADPTALAAALKDGTAHLQGGLKASEREGRPISAKFEIEDGKLQLSEELTDAFDLNDAAKQKAAMAKAKVTLLAATETAVKANLSAAAER